MDTKAMRAELEYLRKLLPGGARRIRILHLLGDGNVHTAAELAALGKVTVRTVWRDIETLRGDGYPIASQHGEGGGYMMRKRKSALWPSGNNREGD